MRLQAKVALVTGAGGGLGGATARRFAAEGASVLCSDLNLAKAEKTAADIEAAGGTALAFACDVADAAQCEAQVAETVNHSDVSIFWSIMPALACINWRSIHRLRIGTASSGSI